MNTLPLHSTRQLADAHFTTHKVTSACVLIIATDGYTHKANMLQIVREKDASTTSLFVSFAEELKDVKSRLNKSMAQYMYITFTRWYINSHIFLIVVKENGIFDWMSRMKRVLSILANHLNADVTYSNFQTPLMNANLDFICIEKEPHLGQVKFKLCPWVCMMWKEGSSPWLLWSHVTCLIIACARHTGWSVSLSG